MVILMTNCKINKHIQEWIDIVENGTYKTCEDQKRLIKHVKRCFATEDIYTDDEQLEKYISLIKYFPYDYLMPWQKFVIVCTTARTGERQGCHVGRICFA